jgi:anti-sigma regulatory factor (Ser/Thr protein kinase)
MVSIENNQITTTIIDQGCGPANCNVYFDQDKVYIHSANHTQNHAALYVVKE